MERQSVAENSSKEGSDTSKSIPIMGSSFQLKLNAGMVCVFTKIIQSWLFEVTADGPDKKWQD